eukprot:3276750-Pyramimonas_sp.AAC.1
MPAPPGALPWPPGHEGREVQLQMPCARPPQHLHRQNTAEPLLAGARLGAWARYRETDATIAAPFVP